MCGYSIFRQYRLNSVASQHDVRPILYVCHVCIIYVSHFGSKSLQILAYAEFQVLSHLSLVSKTTFSLVSGELSKNTESKNSMHQQVQEEFERMEG